MSRRWWGAIAVLTLFAALVASLAWLATAAPARGLPPVGSTLPMVSYQTPEGAVMTLGAHRAPVAVMIFRESCRHCQRQIKALLAHWQDFRLERLVMLTYDRADLARPGPDLEAMARLPGVEVGYLGPEEVARAFGALTTPMLFVYGTHRRLARAFVGEVQADRVAAAATADDAATKGE